MEDENENGEDDDALLHSNQNDEELPRSEYMLKLMDPCLYILTIWTQYMELTINGSLNLHRKR
jgi:hypothetical protein